MTNLAHNQSICTYLVLCSEVKFSNDPEINEDWAKKTKMLRCWYDDKKVDLR
jgi:hypothetical protein